MSDLVKSDAGGLIGLFHGKNDGLSLPKPFEKDIFLAFRYGKRYTSFDGCFPVFL